MDILPTETHMLAGISENSPKQRRTDDIFSITDLPLEVFENIFSYMDGQEQAKSLPSVNKYFLLTYEEHSQFRQLTALIEKIKQKILTGDKFDLSPININPIYKLRHRDKTIFDRFITSIFKSGDSSYHNFKMRSLIDDTSNTWLKIDTLAVIYEKNCYQSQRLITEIEFDTIQSLIIKHLIPYHRIHLSKQLMRSYFWDFKKFQKYIFSSTDSLIKESFCSDLEKIEKLFACMNDPDRKIDIIKNLDWSSCLRYATAFYNNQVLSSQLMEWIGKDNFSLLVQLDCDSLFEVMGHLYLNPNLKIPYWRNCSTDDPETPVQSLEEVSDKFYDKKAFVLVAAKFCENIFKFIDEKSKEDEDVILLVLQHDYKHALKNMHPNLLTKRKILIEIFTNPTATFDVIVESLPQDLIKILLQKLKEDRELFSKACHIFVNLSKNSINSILKEDREFILELTKNNPSLIPSI